MSGSVVYGLSCLGSMAVCVSKRKSALVEFDRMATPVKLYRNLFPCWGDEWFQISDNE